MSFAIVSNSVLADVHVIDNVFLPFYSCPMRNGISDFIDVLRGLAILGVVTVHTLFTVNSVTKSSDYNFFSYIFGLGKYGVELFFFISGLLMFRIYGIDEVMNIRRFFIRRAARIFPLWFGFLALAVVTNYFFQYGGISKALNGSNGGGMENLGLIIVLSSTFTLFLSPNLWNTVIPGGWSIQAEIFHYIAFACFRRKSFNLLLVSCAGINVLTSIILLVTATRQNSNNLIIEFLNAWIRLGFYSTSSFFLLGIMAGILLHADYSLLVGRIREERALRNCTTLFFMSLLIVPTPFGRTVEALGMLLIYLIVGWSLNYSLKFKALFIELGKYSYFIYFSHFIILDSIQWTAVHFNLELIFPFSQKVLLLPMISLVFFLSLAAGRVSMKFIEKPIIDWARSK